MNRNFTISESARRRERSSNKRRLIAAGAMVAVLAGFGVRAIDANAAVAQDGEYQVNVLSPTSVEFGTQSDLMNMSVDLGSFGWSPPVTDQAALMDQIDADFNKTKDIVEQTGWDLDDPAQRARLNDEAVTFLAQWTQEAGADAHNSGKVPADVQTVMGGQGDPSKTIKIIDELTEEGPAVTTCRGRCTAYGWRSFALQAVLTAGGIALTGGLVVTGSVSVPLGVAFVVAAFLISQAFTAFTGLRNHQEALRAAGSNDLEMVALRASSSAAAAVATSMQGQVNALKEQMGVLAAGLAAGTSNTAADSDMMP